MAVASSLKVVTKPSLPHVCYFIDWRCSFYRTSSCTAVREVSVDERKETRATSLTAAD